MSGERNLTCAAELELRTVSGFTQRLPAADLEALTIEVIREHRELVEKADASYWAIPEDYQNGRATSGVQHPEFVLASIAIVRSACYGSRWPSGARRYVH
ncbi:transcriptional repressor TraM [Pararhizobium sp. YC-54]|uniref:transcriptional repressor TraM n=1 Tax=Pararhizobium sp. YC-54 TaxID=2986920 RepID=UPI003557475E